MAQTAVVVELPEVDPIVDPYRRVFDPARARGMPGHITLLYPFVDSDAVDEPTVRSLRDAAATFAPFDVAFERVRWFGSTVAWLAPEPSRPFVDLIAELAPRFPEYPPYEGRFAENIPHLTIGESGLPALADAVEALRRRLPLRSRAKDLSLMVRERTGWHALHRFPFTADNPFGAER